MQLRANPSDLNTNLAKLGATEAALRSELNPANEQRAAGLASLSRGLSRAATGQETANPDGDPKEAAQDLRDLANGLESKTTTEKQQLAQKLTELQGLASQAGWSLGAGLEGRGAEPGAGR